MAAVAAVHNLCVGDARPTQEALADALRRHGITGSDRRRDVLTELCCQALTRVLAGNENAIAEGRAKLERLASDLGLTTVDFAAIERRAATRYYTDRVLHALSDRKLEAAERAHLSAIAGALSISKGEADDIIAAHVKPILAGAYQQMVQDGRYSPAEEKAFKQLAQDLGVHLELDDAAKHQLDRFRRLWEIENGILPEIGVPIALQRGERCHFACHCSWRELRTRTVRVDYHGPTARIRIMKGVYWRVGSIAPQRVTETNLVEVASGTMYVTNKRVILDGADRNKVATWRTVFGQELFADAIKLEKTSGKDPYLFVNPSDLEMASVIISAALNAAG